MAYYVIHPNGSRYGPADIPLLREWADDHRIIASTVLEDERTGERTTAASIPELGLKPEEKPGETAETPPAHPQEGQYQGAGYPSGAGRGIEQPGELYRPRTDTNAVASLVLGLIGLVFWVAPIIELPITIVGIVLGSRARNSQNRVMAIAGIILCVIGLLATLTVIAIRAYWLAGHPIR